MVVKSRRCVIICASPQSDREFIVSRLKKSDFIICADGGADLLVSTGKVPDLIIGDFDSSKNYKYFENVKITVLPVSKDDTDTMYCVRTALEMGFDDFLFLGATGGRLDHMLANLSVLLFLKKNNARGVISDEFGDTLLLKQGDNILSEKKGRTVSIMPFACEEVCLSYKGMMYPLENSVISTEYPYTISNVTVNDNAIVTLHSGNALLVLPRE